MQFPEVIFPTAVNYLGHIDFFPIESYTAFLQALLGTLIGKHQYYSVKGLLQFSKNFALFASVKAKLHLKHY